MRRLSGPAVVTLCLVFGVAASSRAQPAPPSSCGALPAAGPAAPGAAQPVDLPEQLKAGRLRPVNRTVEPMPGTAGAVHVSEGPGPGVVWVEGSDFGAGTIEVMICGRDLLQRSFLGIAFHRQDDDTYEAVYLRPFNFRSDDAARRQHAVQYIAVPAFDWPRLRQEFPEEFENPVEASVAPTAWVPLRLVVSERSVQVFVGTVAAPALEVRRLGTNARGAIGIWTGNGSDGGFARLRYTPAR